jgi:CarD family transcriptional regulator
VEFQVGDKVVYPTQGVTVIESIATEELAGMSIECYTLRLLATESKVVVPVGNADKVGLRCLADEQAVGRSLRKLRANDVDKSGDWKDRYRSNLERLKTGELDEVVDVLLCLAEVGSRKTLSFRERKMFDQARQILVYEVAEVEGRAVDEVSEEVETVLDTHMGLIEEGD